MNQGRIIEYYQASPPSGLQILTQLANNQTLYEYGWVKDFTNAIKNLKL